MSDVSGIQGPQANQPPSPNEIERYKNDFSQGLTLFQKAFEEYNKPDVEAHKKEKLQDVMDKALGVMNETACVAISEGKQGQESQLSKDYGAFINEPTQENQKRVADDISSLQSH